MTEFLDIEGLEQVLTAVKQNITDETLAAQLAGVATGTCTTTVGTTAKTVAITGFTRKIGSIVAVTFNNGNSSASATLNVTSTGAAGMRLMNRTTVPVLSSIPAGYLAYLCYDVEFWILLNPTPTLAHLGAAPANAALTAETGTGTDTATGAVASTTIQALLQTIWAKIRQLANAISTKANDSDVVKLTGAQTIAGIKTFSSAPVVPSKTSAAGSSGTAVATEAQVNLKANLASPTFTGTVSVPNKTTEATNSGTLVATEAQVHSLGARVASLEILGQHVGSFDTRAAVPDNKSGFTNGITINDFVTVRVDETQSNAVTRYIATAINSSTGALTWTYDISYSTDVTGKQDKLNRTVTGNDNATGTVTDTGSNLSVPIPVTVVAPAASTTQTTAGTRSLRAQLKILIDNIASLFSTKANLASPTFTGTPAAPTAAAGTKTTQVATTAFVDTAVNNAKPGAISKASINTLLTATGFPSVP